MLCSQILATQGSELPSFLLGGINFHCAYCNVPLFWGNPRLYNRQGFLIIRSLIHQSLQVRGLDPNLVCLNGQRFLGIPQSTRQNGAWSAPWSSLQCGSHQQATRNVSKNFTSSSLEKGLEKYPLEMKYHELSPIAWWCSIGTSKPSPVCPLVN